MYNISPSPAESGNHLLIHVTGVITVLLFLSFLLGLISPLYSQRYQVDTYTESEGLPSSTVKCIVQDSTGLMWFATRSGITAYNGSRWKTYGLNDGLNTLDNRFILVDGKNRVWAVSVRDGITVSRRDQGGKWTTLPPIDEPLDKKQVSSVELVKLDGKTVLVAVIDREKIYLWKDKSWQGYTLPDRFRGFEIYSLETVKNRVLAGTTAGLISIFPPSPENSLLETNSVPEMEIRGLAYDEREETLWMAGPDWLGKITKGRFETLVTGYAFDIFMMNKWMVCEPDGMGGLFFGNALKLLHINSKGKIEKFSKRKGMIDEGANTIFRDHEGNIWTGGNRGVTKIVSLRFAGYRKEHGLFKNEVTSILKSSSGRMILGHYSGLTLIGDTMETLEFREKGLKTRVLDLDKDSSGNIWIAASGGGLGRMDSSGRIEWVKEDSGLNSAVQSVLVDRKGRIWVASNNNIFVSRGKSFEKLELKGTDKNISFRRLFESRDGAVYAASVSSGLFRIQGDRSVQWKIGDTRNENNVFSLLERDGGNMWVGTYSGLFHGKNGLFERVTAPGPEIRRPVYLILEDSNGRIWFGTDNGVFRWNGEEIVRFTVENGLIGREINRDAGFVDSDGHVWIGTDNGLSIYREEYDRKDNVTPVIELVSLQSNGKTFPLGGRLELEHGMNTFVISFNAISYINEKQIRFRSRLEGFEQEWSKPYISGQRKIRYTDLPAGEYVFHLQAAGYEQPWSEMVSSGTIIINAPFWKSWWFILLCVITAGLIIYFIVTYILQKRYSRKLEIEVRERMNENIRMQEEIEKARKLESLGVLAGGIAHDFNNFLTAIVGNLSLLELSGSLGGKERDLVKRALKAAVRSESLTSQLMTFSRGGEPVIQKGSIVELITESASFILSGSNIKCEYEIPENIRPVRMDPGQISQVISNILINAQEAMPEGGKVTIRAKNFENRRGKNKEASLREGSYVRVEIEDEGKGIPPENMGQIFDPYFTTRETGNGLGLTTAYSIMNRHQGLLKAISEQGMGAKFVFYLPVAERSEQSSTPDYEPVLPSRARILVMDDEEIILSTIREMLSDTGVTVDTATDGDEAVKIYRRSMEESEPYDAVILDLTIPGGRGGRETIRKLIDIDPEVRAVVASGYSNDDVIANYSEYGFLACICKPFSPEELKRAISRALGDDPAGPGR